MSEFRYKCHHGVGLDEECISCSIHTIGSFAQCKRAERNLAHSPTYQQALSRHQAAPGIVFPPETGEDSGNDNGEALRRAAMPYGMRQRMGPTDTSLDDLRHG